MMKKIMALILVMALAGSLCACGGTKKSEETAASSSEAASTQQTESESQTETETETESESPTQLQTEAAETESESETEDSETAAESLSLLQGRIAEQNDVCGLALLGYEDGATVEDVKKLIQDKKEIYPFLADIAEEEIVLLAGGDIYCIVPVSEDASVQVKSVDYMKEGVSEEEAIAGGEIAYEGTGKPVILVCNVSDIVPNSHVTVTAGEASAAFSPYISLQDGSVAAMGAEGGILNFTVEEN